MYSAISSWYSQAWSQLQPLPRIQQYHRQLRWGACWYLAGSTTGIGLFLNDAADEVTPRRTRTTWSPGALPRAKQSAEVDPNPSKDGQNWSSGISGADQGNRVSRMSLRPSEADGQTPSPGLSALQQHTEGNLGPRPPHFIDRALNDPWQAKKIAQFIGRTSVRYCKPQLATRCRSLMQRQYFESQS